jgi:hypothetical protein
MKNKTHISLGSVDFFLLTNIQPYQPVGGEFQPPFETVYPGGGAHLFSVLHSIFVINRITTTAIGNFQQ